MRKNVAGQHVQFQLILKADGDEATGLSPTVVLSVDGGAQGNGSGAITEMGKGVYDYAPTQAETNGNHLSISMGDATVISQTINIYTVSYDPHDTDGLGLSRIDVAISSRSTFDHTANEVTTDTASRDASKADVSNIPAKGQNLRYTNNASGVGSDDVTITDAV